MRRGFSLAVFLIFLTLIITLKHNIRESATEHWDFQAFYLGAQMIVHGEGDRLYDINAQAAAQTRYLYPTRKVTVPDLPFLYPAAATAPFLPLTKFSMKIAFPLWTAMNLLLLLLSLRLLQKVLPLPQDDWPLLPVILFAPTYIVLLNGQVSIVILFLLTLCFYLLHHKRPFLAGFALGLATIKFQLVLGLLTVIALRRMWTMLAGSAVAGFLVAAVSILLTGWHAAIHYPVFLRQVAYFQSVAHPSITVTLRGMLWLVTRHEPRVWLVALFSAGVLVVAAISWKDLSTGFSVALIASILTSYHAHIEELILLVLPFAVFLPRIERSEILTRLAITILVAGYLSLLTDLHTIFALLCYGLIIFGFYRTSEQSNCMDVEKRAAPVARVLPLDRSSL